MQINFRNHLLLGLFFSFILLSLTTLGHAAVRYGVSVGGNRDYPGGDYAQFLTQDLDSCVRSCANDGRCVAFSFQSNTGTCWLKDRFTEGVKVRGFTSGRKLNISSTPPPPPQQKYSTHPPPPRPKYAPVPEQSPRMDFMEGVDLPGGDFQIIKTDNADYCSQICADDDRCYSFTFVIRAHDCFLKSARPHPVQARGVISGVKR